MYCLIIKAETRNNEILTFYEETNLLSFHCLSVFMSKFRHYVKKNKPLKNYITNPEIGENNIKDLFDLSGDLCAINFINGLLSSVKGGYINIVFMTFNEINKREKMFVKKENNEIISDT